MKTKIKRVISWLLLCAMFVWEGSLAGYAAPEETMGPEIGAPSALLMEASTGTVIYEKNADEPRNPASVTKIMTLILIFDALQSGKISLSPPQMATPACKGPVPVLQ